MPMPCTAASADGMVPYCSMRCGCSQFMSGRFGWLHRADTPCFFSQDIVHKRDNMKELERVFEGLGEGSLHRQFIEGGSWSHLVGLKKGYRFWHFQLGSV